MGSVQLLGYAAFIAASAVLSTRLLLLWRRTRELPELAIGLAFLLAGALGYASWFVSALTYRGVIEGDHITFRVLGLGLTCLGGLANAAGIAAAFRPGALRARILLGVLAALMTIGWLDTWMQWAEIMRWTFWLAMTGAAASFLWSASECFRLHVLLRKRVRFGLSSPLIADRALLWTVAFGAVVLMIGSAIVSRVVLGADATAPDWVPTLRSVFGLVCAAAIWLGFFPPAFYRRRFEGEPEAAA